MNDRVYKDRQGGKDVFWTYSDGQTVYLSAGWVQREQRRGMIEVISI